ncbi:hypothetical protein [Tautonia plasticadhaerens]|uniref:Carbohydrate binding module (Family 6) n=1 Tax=Tautonia plasticadhaerens TaxID=2527974 RepID=A0A518H6M2_9BACT|nr:hypothetical protein [Tautonia plasticadhaerens]QDV36473.1 hypothetical protein ElP_43990 [Tautonia plasticadhaerens]
MTTPLSVASVLIAAALSGGEPPFRPEPDRNGILELPASRAGLLGDRLRIEGAPSYVVDWTSATDRVQWDFELAEAGRFVVLVEYGAPAGRGGATFEVVAADQRRQAAVHATGGASRFLPQPMKGAIDLPGGPNRLEVRALDAPGGLVMNLRRIRLVPAQE